MDLVQLSYLFFASVIAGALNSVAGGGSFFTFPALIFAGVPPINANATNSVVVWPGGVASLVAYRKDIGSKHKTFIFFLSVASLIGGSIGALLLIFTPQKLFTELIPYLLLLATVLFTFNKYIVGFLSKHTFLKSSEGHLPTTSASVIQFLISIYGGYFGGGMGIMMLSAFRFFAIKDIHFANGLKVLFAVLINAIAVAIFIFAGIVDWKFAPLMALGAIIGGYGGVMIAKKISQKLIYYFISFVGFSLTLYFFIK